MAMMAIKGIYAEYEVQPPEPRHRLRHRGHRTAAADLRRQPRPEGQDLPALGAQPASGADPGDRGRLRRIGPFLRLGARHGGRTSAPGPTSSSPAPTAACAPTARFCQAAGHYACDLFIGSTLQIDLAGNSSTATLGRIAGFGGAPEHGRRCAGPPPRQPGVAEGRPRGARSRPRALIAARPASWSCRWSRPSASTCSRPSSNGSTPGSWPRSAGMELPPVMIYGDDVSHILTEEGIANLLLCRTDEEREQAIRGVAGYTAVGLGRDKRDGREPARPRRHPSRRGSRHRQAAGDARPARGAVDQGSGPRVGRSLRPAASASATGERDAMETLHFAYRDGRPARGARRRQPCTGVVGSGNLEVLVEPTDLGGACRIEVADRGASASVAIWQAVLDDFFARHPLAGRSHLHQRRRRHAGGGQPAARPGDRNPSPEPSHEAQLLRGQCPRTPRSVFSTPAAFVSSCRRLNGWSVRTCASSTRPAAFDDGIIVGRGTLGWQPGPRRGPGRRLHGRRGRRGARRQAGRPAASARSTSGRPPSCCWSSPAACACTRPTPA